MFERGYRWRIGNGNDIRVQSDPWLRDENNFRVQTHLDDEIKDICVTDLMVPGLKEWYVELVQDMFTKLDSNAILNSPLMGEG